MTAPDASNTAAERRDASNTAAEPRDASNTAAERRDASTAGGGDGDGCCGTSSYGHAPDLGDLIVTLLAGTLAGVRDRLTEDGYHDAAELVADLVDIADDYLSARWA